MSDILAKFDEIARRVQKDRALPAITLDAKITSLGIDSVTMMEIIGIMEDELDITIPDEKLSRLQTVGDIERVVAELRGNA